MKRMQSRGLTLIELMLAVSIFAIVAVVIYSTFSAGISVWRRTQRTQNTLQDIRLSLDKMSEELENAVLYSQESGFPNFVGGKNRVSFYSVVNVFSTLPVHPELRKITYDLDSSADMLQRLEQTFPESVQNRQDKSPEEIAARISNLNFFYYYKDENAAVPYKWKNSWDSAEDIPQAVKIELKLDSEEKLVFTKYVFIPTGKRPAEV